jgi:hypothetical protein
MRFSLKYCSARRLVSDRGVPGFPKRLGDRIDHSFRHFRGRIGGSKLCPE